MAPPNKKTPKNNVDLSALAEAVNIGAMINLNGLGPKNGSP